MLCYFLCSYARRPTSRGHAGNQGAPDRNVTFAGPTKQCRGHLRHSGIDNDKPAVDVEPQRPGGDDGGIRGKGLPPVPQHIAKKIMSWKYGGIAARVLGGAQIRGGRLKTRPAKEGPASDGNHYMDPVLRVLRECSGN